MRSLHLDRKGSIKKGDLLDLVSNIPSRIETAIVSILIKIRDQISYGMSRRGGQWALKIITSTNTEIDIWERRQTIISRLFT